MSYGPFRAIRRGDEGSRIAGGSGCIPRHAPDHRLRRRQVTAHRQLSVRITNSPLTSAPAVETLADQGRGRSAPRRDCTPHSAVRSMENAWATSCAASRAPMLTPYAWPESAGHAMGFRGVLRLSNPRKSLKPLRRRDRGCILSGMSMDKYAREVALEILAEKGLFDPGHHRLIEGIAATAVLNKNGTILDPAGALFTLPVPLLFSHNWLRPIGRVTRARLLPLVCGSPRKLQISN